MPAWAELQIAPPPTLHRCETPKSPVGTPFGRTGAVHPGNVGVTHFRTKAMAAGEGAAAQRLGDLEHDLARAVSAAPGRQPAQAKTTTPYIRLDAQRGTRPHRLSKKN